MSMNEQEYVTEEYAVKKTGKSANTLMRWRHGKYFRRKVGGIYYFSDKRKLKAKKMGGVWHYDRLDLELWNTALNERSGAWRRSE